MHHCVKQGVRMFRKTLLTITAILLFSVCFTGQLIQGQVQEKLFNIIVEINCKDETLKKTLETHIHNSLRNINDVVLNSKTQIGTHAMHIFASEQKNKLTGKTGYISVAIAVSQVFYPYHNLKWSLPEEKSKQAMALIKEAEFPLILFHHRETFLITGDIKDLPTICQNFINKVDKEIINEERLLLVQEFFGLPPKE